jgi:hypothetical protein
MGQTLEAEEHRSRASELLARALQNRDLANRDNCVLAAILILITLDVRVVSKVSRTPWTTLILGSARYRLPGTGRIISAKLQLF